MSDPISLADALLAMRQGQLDPVALTEQCLSRISRYEDRVRAWVVVDREAALAQARDRAAAATRSARPGPLCGIPLGIKDIVDVEGLPTRAGSLLRAGVPARRDAPLVARLRRAGAIILGKTVTTEFAYVDPPPTRNPWDPALGHTPGGSSSGSAVAVALGMCLGAVGTQTGGSLIRPASYCGVAALKPTFGRIDLDGVVPVAHHLDHAGVIARSARDLELLIRVLADLGEEPRAQPTPPPRLGVLEDFFLSRADEAIRSVTRAALARLGDCGATIRAVELPPGFDELDECHRRIMAVEAAAVHRGPFREHRAGYGPKLAALLDEGLSTLAVDYAAALAHQREFCRRVDPWLGPLDAMVMPATETTAPATLETTGPADFQRPWSYAGVPAVTIPCGLAADGMPAGLQLVGPRNGEAGLLRVAQWCERSLDFRHLPPLWSDG